MKILQGVLRSANGGLFHRLRQPQPVRAIFTGSNDKQSTNLFESEDAFEQRIFHDSGRDSPRSSSFFRQMDRMKKYDVGSILNQGNNSGFMDDLDHSFNTLSDGMDRKLKEAARYFEYDSEEVEKEDYAFRPDVNFRSGDTYEPKDLDLTKPGIRRPFRNREFVTTTEEVLQKADFRNVQFLANFITEAGIIIKRSHTKISAKAQRKVAREIKTARAFGLMPFTTMGNKQFVAGRSMENLDEDYEFEAAYNTDSFVDNSKDPI